MTVKIKKEKEKETGKKQKSRQLVLSARISTLSSIHQTQVSSTIDPDMKQAKQLEHGEKG